MSKKSYFTTYFLEDVSPSRIVSKNTYPAYCQSWRVSYVSSKEETTAVHVPVVHSVFLFVKLN